MVIIIQNTNTQGKSQVTSVHVALSKVLPAGPTKALLFFFLIIFFFKLLSADKQTTKPALSSCTFW